MTYQFSDTELAARRLSYLAGVFEPTTRSFLAESAAHRQGICWIWDAASVTPPICLPR